MATLTKNELAALLDAHAALGRAMEEMSAALRAVTPTDREFAYTLAGDVTMLANRRAEIVTRIQKGV